MFLLRARTAAASVTDAASAVIRHNRNRKDKRLWTDHQGGEPGDVNEGSNLFVTGIHPRLTEEEITVLFEKHGRVEKCNIMRDPHTRESRGFGFVKMVGSARPRTPTPGKYFGPPKREDRPARGGYRDRYDVSSWDSAVPHCEPFADEISGPWTPQALRRPSRWPSRPLRCM